MVTQQELELTLNQIVMVSVIGTMSPSTSVLSTKT